MSQISDVEEVVNALRALRIGKITQEYDLQSDIAGALVESDIGFMKEYVLGPGNRVDFMTSESRIVIEVKKGKPNRTRLMEQIARYAAFEDVKGIVVVVETSLRVPPNSRINGKPCTILGLQKLWGIAL